MITEEVKNISDTIISWITLLIVVLGAIVTTFQYIDSKNQSKIKEALKYVDNYQKEPIFSSKLNVETAWNINGGYRKYCFILDEAIDKNKTKKECNEISKETTLKIIYENNISKDIYSMFEFYRGVITCVKSDICDYETIYNFFYDEIKNFYITFYPYVEKVRNSNFENYLIEIENYKNNPKNYKNEKSLLKLILPL